MSGVTPCVTYIICHVCPKLRLVETKFIRCQVRQMSCILRVKYGRCQVRGQLSYMSAVKYNVDQMLSTQDLSRSNILLLHRAGTKGNGKKRSYPDLHSSRSFLLVAPVSWRSDVFYSSRSIYPDKATGSRSLDRLRISDRWISSGGALSTGFSCPLA